LKRRWHKGRNAGINPGDIAHLVVTCEEDHSSNEHVGVSTSINISQIG
jgi:hypothetical protein